jgi:hypothetical protein
VNDLFGFDADVTQHRAMEKRRPLHHGLGDVVTFAADSNIEHQEAAALS